MEICNYISQKPQIQVHFAALFRLHIQKRHYKQVHFCKKSYLFCSFTVLNNMLNFLWNNHIWLLQHFIMLVNAWQFICWRSHDILVCFYKSLISFIGPKYFTSQVQCCTGCASEQVHYAGNTYMWSRLCDANIKMH